MLTSLLVPGAEMFPLLNLFRYITFRSGGALLTALALVLLCGPRLIALLKSRQGEGQPIRSDGPSSHLHSKVGTPTMGGVLILLAFSCAVLLWSDLANPWVWLLLALTLSFAAVGFADDCGKLRRRSHQSGLGSRQRLFLEFILALLFCFAVQALAPRPLSGVLAFPFFKTWLLDLAWFLPIFGSFVVVGAANAVNLTDGLDGLASVPIILAAASFALISYLVGNSVFSSYLQLPYIPGSGELAVVCAALIGAVVGFLWFNAQPAEVFMGDTGSLACGAALAGVAVITKHEIVLAIVGGLFVVEVLSVMIQIGVYKWKGRRVFLMAPLHHHFEQRGWPESKIVIRFWIVALVCALIGLATLKLR